MAETQLVFPGDELAVAEEFIPGDGTYEEGGKVYAARIGSAVLDTNEFMASVEARTTVPARLRPDDIVIGRIVGLRTSFAMVDIQAKADAPNRDIAGSTNGTLHISKVSRDYVDKIEDALRLGDIVRARVLEVKPAVQITTKGAELGVLLARCPRCRTEMEARGHGLICPSCEWKSRAVLAADYGAGFLMPPDDIEERDRARNKEHRDAGIDFPSTPVPRPDSDRRGGGGDRRGGGGRRRGGGGHKGKGGRKGGGKGGGKGGRRN